MAKPHRMAAATLGVMVMALMSFLEKSVPLVFWTLIVINAGIIITLWRRTRHLATALNQKA
jgi:hypothetical protein